jgi:hypothetical protein
MPLSAPHSSCGSFAHRTEPSRAVIGDLRRALVAAGERSQ